MRNLTFFLLMVIGLLACRQEDGPSLTEPEIPNGFTMIHLDGPNNDAPVLPPDPRSEAAVRLTASRLQANLGDEITDIWFYIADRPNNFGIRIYKGSIGDTPDSLIYDRPLGSNLEANAWSRHQLVQPVLLENDDYWLCMYGSWPQGARSFGCDLGPARQNGDWLYRDLDGLWQTFQNRSGASINWNIRAGIAP